MDSGTKQIYVIRHTRVSNDQGLCYGQSDIDLAESHPVEVRKIREGLYFNPSHCYSSPSQRCHLLAKKIAETQICLDERLLELNFGAWEQQAWSDIPRQQLDDWGNHYIEQGPPEGESFLDLHGRCREFLEELKNQMIDLDRQQPMIPLIVAHAGIIRSMSCHFEGKPLREAFSKDISYGLIYTWDMDSLPAS